MQFDYDSKGDGETATYRGFTIKAMRDTDAQNPFTDWDCEPPLATYYDRSLTQYDDCGGMLDPLSGLSDSWINRRWKEAAKAIGCDVAAMVADVADRCAGERVADVRRDYLETALSDAQPSHYGGNAGDYFESVAALWAMRGVVAVTGYSTGYCQGDYADVLCVVTPAWAKKIGAPRASHKRQADYAIKLYGYWAWGDCYGWEIVSPDGDELDSVWGYYGGDHEESGLAETAREHVDWIIDAARKAKADKLKELIRNRVPVALRPTLLADAGRYQGSV